MTGECSHLSNLMLLLYMIRSRSMSHYNVAGLSVLRTFNRGDVIAHCIHSQTIIDLFIRLVRRYSAFTFAITLWPHIPYDQTLNFQHSQHGPPPPFAQSTVAVAAENQTLAHFQSIASTQTAKQNSVFPTPIQLTVPLPISSNHPIPQSPTPPPPSSCQ